jgi:hypothetical protein
MPPNGGLVDPAQMESQLLGAARAIRMTQGRVQELNPNLTL